MSPMPETHPAPQSKEAQTEHQISDVQEADCCIVGGGPAGVVLAYLLARKGLRVCLLEMHTDFDRDFRGDTIHPSVLEVMDQLGLAERLHEMRHSKIRSFNIQVGDDEGVTIELGFLKTKYPYIMMLPQAHFLEFMTEEAKKFPGFQLIMGASVQELIREGGAVRGVRYREHEDDEWHEVRAALTVGADGRSSRVRRLAEMELVKTAPPMDVLWFRLPRREGDPEGVAGRIRNGHILVMLDRMEEWQIAFVILKGSYHHLREAGVEQLKRLVVETDPTLSDRIDHLQEWKQVSMLSVESSRLKQWYQPGLLLIGDAAHVMSPVGGVGINYAIQDAVVAANVLTKPLTSKSLQTNHLARVQRKRKWPTRFIQAFQAVIQKRILANALDTSKQFKLPFFLRLPLLRRIPARLIAFGIWPVRVEN
ncbi:MAG: FAD-dependent oxidoreductase [Pyrinomonadaceae bacterium]|nr:FAD-dependent oxidoreductase [Pyrinomonadaceae bacterium]